MIEADEKKVKLLEKYGFEAEKAEVADSYFGYTGFPKPLHSYRLIYESYALSIEEVYFWILEYIRAGWQFPKIDKITDIFAASEQSAFFGVAQQRLGLQQDKVSQFLATVGKMVKELFQLVRELRILDERLQYYNDSYSDNREKSEPAEITLKGIWIDLVEQGAKNPASVYGMARELGFSTLPDLFFGTHPKTSKDVKDMVERLEFNRKVKEVLMRKLYSFLRWKEETFKELQTKRIFTVRFLRQHYDVIKMYLNWVRPYLRNIKRMSMDEKKVETVDIISAFEGSMVEIEFLAQNPMKHGINACVLINFDYRTKPSMSYVQEGYQRGPIHVGRVDINFKSYAWTNQHVKQYKAMKEAEDMELIGVIDSSLKAAMEALGDELMNYLKESGEMFPEKPKPIKTRKSKIPGALDPFVSLFKGFGEISSALIGKTGEKKQSKKKIDKYALFKEQEKAAGYANNVLWNVYKNFKKANGMLAWY